jgi:hypothetical protein
MHCYLGANNLLGSCAGATPTSRCFAPVGLQCHRVPRRASRRLRYHPDKHRSVLHTSGICISAQLVLTYQVQYAGFTSWGLQIWNVRGLCLIGEWAAVRHWHAPRQTWVLGDLASCDASVRSKWLSYVQARMQQKILRRLVTATQPRTCWKSMLLVTLRCVLRATTLSLKSMLTWAMQGAPWLSDTQMSGINSTADVYHAPLPHACCPSLLDDM